MTYGCKKKEADQQKQKQRERDRKRREDAVRSVEEALQRRS